ncbi:MAG: copper-binding protein [Burkholderiales bacterium]|nr:copper-binding protein [Burkholderiales bacterium]
MLRFTWPLAALFILPGASPAQQTAPPSATAASPVQSGAASAPPAALSAQSLRHDSALTGYRKYRDEKLAVWRDVNDTAGVLGGHNAHLRAVAAKVNLAGTVMEIDPAQARVRIDGDAVRELGWPAGIAFWSLKSPGLAAQVRPGQRVAVTLELEGDAYRVTAFDHNAPPRPKPAAAADPHAGHGAGARK